MENCYHCDSPLSTDHLKTCEGTLLDRKEIESRMGLKAVKVLEDPSLLNFKFKNLRNSLKRFVAERVSRIIISSARGA